MDELQMPVITDDAILPVPINPKFINKGYFIMIIFELINKKKSL
jgi:hypothetical protein